MSNDPLIAINMPDRLDRQRVILRRYADEDAAARYAMIEVSRGHLQRWLPGFERERSLEDIRESICHGQSQWAQRESFSMGLFLQSGRLLGDLRLRPTH